MKQKYSILTVVLFFSINLVFSQKVDFQTSKSIAAEFYQAKNQTKAIPVLARVDVEDSDTLVYIYNFGNEGFVIIAGDKKLNPVLAYSTEGAYIDDASHFPFNDWVEYYASQVKSARNMSNIEVDPNWNSGYNAPTTKGKAFGVSPLLSTKWNQDSYYNYYCPENLNGPGGRCYAGCVATTMSQIMKYWNYPAKGIGSHSYYHPYYVSISANFDTTYYNWASMTNTINSASKEAIATLMYHCGVAVDMSYGPYGSGASSGTVPSALRNYFNYHPSIEIYAKTQFSPEDWKALLWDNLDQGRPIYYSGSGSSGGHAFVMDGYSDSNYFHFNWGWGGANNGYFSLTSLNSGNGDFTLGQQAVVNIMPYDADYCQKNRVLTSPSRTFGDGSGYSKYWNNTQCDWLIQPADADQIILNFTEFRTESGVDILTVYDGANTSGQVLGVFSGNNLPSTLIANSGSMFLTFTSNSTIQDFGWEASYQTITLGLSDNSSKGNMAVFPNPSNSYIMAYFGNNKNAPVEFRIISLVGATVKSGFVNPGYDSSVKIDVSDVESGFYMLQIIDAGEVHSKPILKN